MSRVRKKRKDRKQNWSIQPQGPPPRYPLLPVEAPLLKGFIAFPNGTSSWGLGVRTREPIGAFKTQRCLSIRLSGGNSEDRSHTHEVSLESERQRYILTAAMEICI